MAVLSVVGITLVGYRASSQQTTMALAFLLGVLDLAPGAARSLFMSVIATLAFNYYFLPPIGPYHRRSAELDALSRFSSPQSPQPTVGARTARGASRHRARQELERLRFQPVAAFSDNPPSC